MNDCEIQVDLRGFIKSKINGNSHTLETALNELIHNSIASNADDIFILHNNYVNPIIVDNGNGMDKNNMDKLKKFYDSSKRKSGEIGTYNIGLKEALLKIGGKWIILSKKSNTDDIVYCDFNSVDFTTFANGGEYQNCIDSGYCNKPRQQIFENILDELGLINKKKESSLYKFSGTVVYQLENNVEDNEEENQEMYNILYNNLQIKLSQYSCNFKYGSYTISNKHISINDTELNNISKLDWLLWNQRNSNNSIEFNIIPYKTAKNTLFAISYNNNNYKYNKSKDIYDRLQSMNSLGQINIKCNIISESEYKTQELHYKNLNYKSSLNGIILCRNGLNLYDFPNKWDGVFMKDTNSRRYARIFVSFIGSDTLDTLFNILPNKSLFLSQNINKKLKTILELVKSIIYDYLDLDLHFHNSISLNDAFKNVLENFSLDDLNEKVKKIKNLWTTIYMKSIIKTNILNLSFYKKYKLFTKLQKHYSVNNINIIKKYVDNFKYNFTTYKNESQLLKHILWIQKRYRLLQKYKVFQKLYLPYTISSYYRHLNNNSLFIYFTYLKRQFIKQKLNKYRFVNLYSNVFIKKKYTQFMLLKYKFLVRKLESSILIM